jgi:preprotein translocase subunit SecA
VEIRPETRTLASLTIQNLFRSYPRLSGMTGTAKGEEEELVEIYGLEVLEVPTNRPVVRDDEPDLVYLRARDRDAAVVARIRSEHAKGRPVLVGTESVERSEHLSRLLDAAGLSHRVLNARQNAEEAAVVAQAGRLGAITIATNMAGRGTDIKLGGDAARRIREELAHLDAADPARASEVARIRAEVEAERAAVVAAGGLFVLGVGRHESRRVDDQLRGRSGRQGDPGGSAFYVSMEDPLMRAFGGERIAKVLAAAGMREGEALVSPMVAKALEKAQRRAEALAFEARRQVLRYDEVQNAQRIAFQKTRDALVSEGLEPSDLEEMRAEVLERMLLARTPEEALPEQWDLDGLASDLDRAFALSLPLSAWAEEEGVDAAVMWERVRDAVEALFADRAEAVGREAFDQASKEILVAELDAAWRDHMEAMASLRQGIGLRAYGQRDPLREWQIEAYGLYQEMMAEARGRTVARLARLTPPPPLPELPPMPEPLSFAMRRNAPCPCGSGLRWKRCHGHPFRAEAVR